MITEIELQLAENLRDYTEIDSETREEVTMTAIMLIAESTLPVVDVARSIHQLCTLWVLCEGDSEESAELLANIYADAIPCPRRRFELLNINTEVK